MDTFSVSNVLHTAVKIPNNDQVAGVLLEHNIDIDVKQKRCIAKRRQFRKY